MHNDLDLLAEVIDRARDLLLTCEYVSTATRMSELAERLRTGDQCAIVSAVSEATGGMGSLNDQVLFPAGANDRFRTVVSDVERLARVAAARRSISLVR